MATEVVDVFAPQRANVELQLKAIETLIKWNESVAKIESQRLKDVEQSLRNAALAQIQAQLTIALKTLNKHRHDAEQDLDRLAANQKKLGTFATAFKQPSASAVRLTFDALNRVLAELPFKAAAAFVAAAVGADARTGDNFLPGGGGTSDDAPDGAKNIGLLTAWMAEEGVFFRRGTPAHLAILAALEGLGAAAEAASKALSEKVAALRETDFASAERLAALLGLAPAAVKAPAPKP